MEIMISHSDELTNAEILALIGDVPGNLYTATDTGDQYKIDDSGVAVSSRFNVYNLDNKELKVSDTRQVISPIDGVWQDIRDKQGERLSWITNPIVYNRPFGLFSPAVGELYMSDYGNKGGKVDPLSETPLDFLFSHTHQNPTTTNQGIAYCASISISPDGTKVALGNHVRDNIRIYEIGGGSNYLSEIGIARSAGNISADKLNNPYGNTMWVDNNTLAVPIHSGNTESSGAIATYDVSTTTATLLNQVMVGENSGSSTGANFIDNPMDIMKDPLDATKAYVTEYGKNRFLHVNISDPTQWIVERQITPPTGTFLDTLWGASVSHDGQYLAATSLNRKTITVINLNTGALVASHKVTDFELADVRAVAFLDRNFIAGVGYNTRNLSILPIQETIDIPFSPIAVPEGMRIETVSTPNGATIDYTDLNNPILTVSTKKLDCISDIFVLFVKD